MNYNNLCSHAKCIFLDQELNWTHNHSSVRPRYSSSNEISRFHVLISRHIRSLAMMRPTITPQVCQNNILWVYDSKTSRTSFFVCDYGTGIMIKPKLIVHWEHAFTTTLGLISMIRHYFLTYFLQCNQIFEFCYNMKIMFFWVYATKNCTKIKTSHKHKETLTNYT